MIDVNICRQTGDCHTGNGKDIKSNSTQLNNNKIELGFLIKLFWLFKL